jgi:hypothetical protein
VAAVFIIGAYLLFRYVPQVNHIDGIQKKAEATKSKLLKARIPDEPREDLETLERELKDQEQALSLLQTESELISSQLAAFDSQELKVRISQLARESQLRIRVNETLKTIPHVSTVNSKLTKNKKSKKVPVQEEEALILPPTMSWVARMGKGTLLHRPLQRLEIEGDFSSIQQFIYGLESLPWQVTVLRLKIEKMPNPAPYGYAQPLLTELVLAL